MFVDLLRITFLHEYMPTVLFVHFGNSFMLLQCYRPLSYTNTYPQHYLLPIALLPCFHAVSTALSEWEKQKCLRSVAAMRNPCGIAYFTCE